ncbi:hypothetical protein Pcinc_004255 [Petrolisthes cinctipes]|uniref:Olfactomedin-like domain-containing protein n=1 Tax=Petrolisthes cinctipes TaxID=88211 RepID=A0AAE1GH97_PETCI|nr:hypothetical protein Pcinc_004255 [Petrolisthes cinctipes]
MGPMGPLGDQGDTGERRDRGLPGLKGDLGPKGLRGDPGLLGPRGPKGEMGNQGISGLDGRPGLDGRDGLPGEPGLDGVPGRNGLDGLSGTDGIPGINGAPGRNGQSGFSGQREAWQEGRRWEAWAKRESSRHHRPATTGTENSLTFGHPAPSYEGFDDLCPTCPYCQKCSEGRGALFAPSYRTFGNKTVTRKEARLITAVGKPVFHRHTNNNYGSWMRDTNNETDPHYWTTDPNHNDILKEFANKNDFRNNGRSITYQLPTSFQMLFSWDKGNLLTYPVRESGMDTGPLGSDYEDHSHSSS